MNNGLEYKSDFDCFLSLHDYINRLFASSAVDTYDKRSLDFRYKKDINRIGAFIKLYAPAEIVRIPKTSMTEALQALSHIEVGLIEMINKNKRRVAFHTL